ncbi:MAG TPA: SGNH/GDSL hydrolase family protein [Solirubrobacterales bacterium]|nr:SGNH/GDSL hydrolase family protein [Solirubrobacterales bacterium]
MRRAVFASMLALAALLALVLAPAATAAADEVEVEVGKVRLATAPSGQPALLVPVTYPIEMAGRLVRLTVSLRRPDGSLVRVWRDHSPANAGPLRTPERRGRFVFVHRIDVDAAAAIELRAGSQLRLAAKANLNPDRDSGRERYWLDSDAQPVPLASGGAPVCATTPRLRARPGRAVVVPLPLCTQPIRWTFGERPDGGNARIRDGALVFRSSSRFRGTADLTLVGHPTGRASASVTPAFAVAPVLVTVGAAKAPVVRALGDSVTAAFGYYEDGSQMSIARLFSCRPPVGKYDDACSSNSKVQSNTVEEVEYATDYGLSNNVSWAAQWANEHGVSNFKNFAISGSRPQDWFGEGQFAETTKELESEDPDYVLATIGANPILTETLFGIDNMGCAVWADIFGEYQACIERAFDKVNLAENLRGFYSELVKNTDAQIIAMQYHLSVPSSAIAYTAVQIAEMADLMNAEIAAAAAAVSKTRIDVVTPPHFNVGISLAPVYPAKYKCKGLLFNSRVDGPSVQSTPSQVFLRVAHPLEFCGGPVTGPPWVISGDTGIHPSAAGYAQMASQVPAPE